MIYFAHSRFHGDFNNMLVCYCRIFCGCLYLMNVLCGPVLVDHRCCC